MESTALCANTVHNAIQNDIPVWGIFSQNNAIHQTITFTCLRPIDVVREPPGRFDPETTQTGEVSWRKDVAELAFCHAKLIGQSSSRWPAANIFGGNEVEETSVGATEESKGRL